MPRLKAYIKRLRQEPSNFRCEGTFDTFKGENIPGLYGVDAGLDPDQREYGVMNARHHGKPDVAALCLKSRRTR